MFNYCAKALLVFVITLLSWICPAFAAVRQVMDTSAQYFDDIQPSDTLASLKARRDLNTQRLRQEILQNYPNLKNNETDFAKALIERKIRIARERVFLNRELQKGVEDLYRDAVEKYAQKKFSASQKDFVHIQGLCANYKETRNYLQKLTTPVLEVENLRLVNTFQIHKKPDDKKVSQLNTVGSQGGKK